MGKIDIDKFVCSLFEIIGNTSYKIRMSNIIDALRHQGLEYKDGAIVAIEKPKTIKFAKEPDIDAMVEEYWNNEDRLISSHTRAMIEEAYRKGLEDMYLKLKGELV